MNQQTREFAAQVLGTIACETGMPCVPALDPELAKLYNPGVENRRIIRAWIDGWTFENLWKDEEPIVEVCYCCSRGDKGLAPCMECGESLCEDCTPPFGGHVCEPG